MKVHFPLLTFATFIGSLSTSIVMFVPATNAGSCYRLDPISSGRSDSSYVSCSSQQIERQWQPYLNPLNLSIENNRGQYHFEPSKYRGRIADTSKDADFYAVRGVKYSMQGKYAETIADFSKAIELNPNIDGFYINRGNAYHKMKDYQSAFADCNKAISLNSTNANSYNCRGNALFRMNKFQAAIADYDRGIQILPNDLILIGNRGRAYYYLNDRRSADNDFNKITTICQGNNQKSECEQVMTEIQKLKK
jgi:tetratricopeptide (TPR) repeat protein